MGFYRVVLNQESSDLWFPDSPVTTEGDELDPRCFCNCVPWHGQGPLKIPKPEGASAHFAFGEFNYPLVYSPVANRITEMDSTVQLIAVEVTGSRKSYVILNVLRAIQCIDEDASEFDRFEPTGPRPDLTGNYQTFYKLRVNPQAIPKNAHIFRLDGFRLALIVSTAMKELLEIENANDGITFNPVL